MSGRAPVRRTISCAPQSFAEQDAVARAEGFDSWESWAATTLEVAALVTEAPIDVLARLAWKRLAMIRAE